MTVGVRAKLNQQSLKKQEFAVILLTLRLMCQMVLPTQGSLSHRNQECEGHSEHSYVQW